MLHQCLVSTLKSSFISLPYSRNARRRGRHATSMLSFDSFLYSRNIGSRGRYATSVLSSDLKTLFHFSSVE